MRVARRQRIGAVAGCGRLFVVAVAVVFLTAPPARGQVVQRAVGGIAIDASGALVNASVDDVGQLRALREKALEQVPADLAHASPLRKVSLKSLDTALREQLAGNKRIGDAMQHLAGLQQIQYVLVYPEQHDVVLVGPAEGWKVDPHGDVVGVGTHRPVLLLDDLVVALRSARLASQGGITCSIDPTQEGIARLQQLVRGLSTIGPNRQATITAITDALGPQTISVNGVPATSHMARVLVAADYRMKRLAMDLEPAPIRNFPSYMQMVQAGRRGMNNLMPRWWLASQWTPLVRDSAGLAWQVTDAKVKALTEEDLVASDGSRQHTGKGNPVAEKWADMMTARYDELALADPVFAQLRNCMNLALVAALSIKEDLPGKAHCSLNTLLDEGQLPAASYPAPRHVDSQASLVKKGSNWVISASGGVRIDVGAAVAQTQQGDVAVPLHCKAAAQRPTAWWWD